jgi:hypothetical protein
MNDGPGIERLRAAPGAEALRENTVATQAAARADAAKKIAAAKKTKPGAKKKKTKAKKIERITDDLVIKVLAGATNPFTKGTAIYKRAGWVIAANKRTVADAKKGMDGTIVKAMLDRGMIELVRP